MDTADLLKLLNTNNVKYVIIGATAFPVYGYARATLDLDIFVEPTEENITKTMTALKDFGYDLSELTEKEMLENKILIRQYIIETDIHPFVKGVSFAEVWDSKIEAEYYGVTVYFASLDNLIKMKKAAGRPKDKEDLKILKKLRNNNRKK